MTARPRLGPLHGMALVAVAAFSVTAGHPPVVLVLLGLAACACVWGGILHVPRSPLLLGGVLLGVAMLSLAGPPPSTHLFGPEAGKTGYGGGLAACLVLVALLWRRNTDDERYLVMAVSLIVTLVAGVTREPLPYAWMAGLEITFLAWFLRDRLPGQSCQASRRRAVAVLVLSLFAGATMARTLAWSETQLNSLLAFASSFSDPLSASAAFAPNSRLSSLRRMQESTRVVLRVTSSSPPRYMVARRYESYRDRTWHSEVGSRPGGRPPATAGIESSGVVLATVSATWRPMRVDQVEMDPSGADTLPVPPDGVAVAAGSVPLELDPCALPRLPPDCVFDGSYQVARGGLSSVETQGIAGGPCLELPAPIPPVVGRLATVAVVGCRSPEEKARAIETFLQGHCAYGPDYPFSEKGDPVAEFLEKRPAAHCELFATSMVLMLRSQGIPSRYVTGFLLRQHGLFGSGAVGRMKDAHAWVEARLPGRGWTTFDPTPPAALAAEPWSWWEQWLDLALRQWVRLKGSVQAALARARTQGSTVLAAIVTAALLACLLRRTRPRWGWPHGHTRASAAGPSVDPRLLRLWGLLEDFDRVMASRGLVRPPASTLLEWGTRVGQDTSAARFLHAYSEARYRNGVPDLSLLERLADLLRAVAAEEGARRGGGVAPGVGRGDTGSSGSEQA